MPCGGLTPEDRVCGGHGYCDTALDACVCDAGWSGVGDIIGSPLQDCFVHTDTVFAFWLVVAVFEFARLVWSLQFFNWRAPPVEVKTTFVKRPAFRVHVAHQALTISMLFLAIYKCSHYPSVIPAVGHDFVCTLAYTVGTVFLHFGLLNNIWTWESAVAHANTAFTKLEIEAAVRGPVLIGTATFFVLILDHFVLLFTIHGLNHDSSDHSAAFAPLAGVFWTVRGFGMLGFAFSEFFAAQKLYRLLDSIRKPNSPRTSASLPPHLSTDSLRDTLRYHMGTFAVVSTLVGLSSIVIGLWPYGRTLGAYVIPLTIFFSSFAKVSLVKTLPNYSAIAKAKQQLKLKTPLRITIPGPGHGTGGSGSTPRQTNTPSGVSSNESSELVFIRQISSTNSHKDGHSTSPPALQRNESSESLLSTGQSEDRPHSFTVTFVAPGGVVTGQATRPSSSSMSRISTKTSTSPRSFAPPPIPNAPTISPSVSPAPPHVPSRRSEAGPPPVPPRSTSLERKYQQPQIQLGSQPALMGPNVSGILE